MEINKTIIQKEKNPKDYFPYERRAEMLKLVIEVGHPDALNRSQLAERYGISQSMISKEFKKIKKEIIKNIGTDADVIMETVFRKTIKKGIKSENIRDNVAAAQVAKMWYDWLFDIGKRQKMNQPQQLQQLNINVKMTEEQALELFEKTYGKLIENANQNGKKSQ